MLMGFRCAILAVTCALCLSARTAQADPIRFEFTGVGTGSLAGKTFTNAPFFINLYGDTANITRPSSDVYSLEGSSNFNIEGIGSGDFTQSTRVFSNVGNRTVGFSRGSSSGSSDLVNLTDPAFAGYDLTRPLALVREEDPTAVSQFNNISTSLGLLTFTAIDVVTFRAVPEPSAGLAALGLAIVTLRRRRA
jgi:hypothetical protein